MQDDADLVGDLPDRVNAAPDVGRDGLIAGRYRVVRRLGSGAMGEVFEVAHPSLPRNEAVKLVAAGFSSDADFKARFLREADVMATLMHPNIVTVFDRGEDESGRMWLAMELVNGEDAAQLVAEHGPMPPSLVADIVAGAGAALDFAWRTARVTHRDVKPANIMVGLDAQGNAELVKLADFGIAKAAAATELTATGLMVGTLAYMSPEAFEGGPLDGFADQYSLGCTAFALLTGRSPYAADSRAVMIAGHLNRPVPAITALRPDLRTELNAVFERVLAKDPSARFDSCAQFAAAFRAAAASPVHSTAVRPVVLAPTADTLGSAGSAGSHGAFGSPHVRPAAPVAGSGSLPARTRSRRKPLLIGAGVLVIVIAAVVAAVVALSGGSGSASPDANTIAVGDGPMGIAVAPDGRSAYVTNVTDNTVSVLDLEAKAVKQTITVGASPMRVAIAPTGSSAYVSNSSIDDSIWVIDTGTDTASQIPGVAAADAPMPGQGQAAYIANGASLLVIDTATNSLARRIAYPGSAGKAVSRDGSLAYVADIGNGCVATVSVITNIVNGCTIPVGRNPVELTMNHAGTTLYVTNWQDNTVSVIDTATQKVTSAVVVGTAPSGIAVSPGDDAVFIANSEDGTVSAINTETNTVTETITVGAGPQYVALSPDGKTAYVTNHDDDTVSVIPLG